MGGGTLPHEMLAQLIAALPEPAQHLLALVAVAAEPTAVEVLERAAVVDDTREALALLGAERLVIVSDGWVEPAHDLIREAALARLGVAERARYHVRLAGAHTAPGVPAYHLEAAGEMNRAAAGAEARADEAASVLAWHRAIAEYNLALAARPPEAHRLYIKLGQALGQAGLGVEAGRTLQASAALAANKAQANEAHVLRLEATLRLLYAGRVEEASAAIARCLRSRAVAAAACFEGARIAALSPRAAVPSRARLSRGEA